ncbi:MAG TPA: protein-L-isoaspartate(D-aspartate) O-methyltransferase [Thermoanaerobaculia bacterium]|nr:protein-L-isoaspartate(D-aspartate) O-methyltransferase [Thermoanaerobaculia bacterium]
MRGRRAFGAAPAREPGPGRRRLAALAVLLLVPALLLALPTAAQRAARDAYAELRRQMVDSQVAARGVANPRVLAALREVPRHLFAPDADPLTAYADRPLPIGHGQTISQPYIVARMTELLDLEAGDEVLEIGTGSGYHTAVLSRVARRVWSVEILEPMARAAARRLESLGYDNVEIRAGDGYKGWEEHAPFDAIILTAAPPRIPQPLIDQLKVGGRMVVPVGGYIQDLQVLTKTPHGLEKRTVIPVRLQPMTGEVRNGS